MQLLTPHDYLRIELANQYGHGLDKLTWKERIAFNDYTDTPDEPWLFQKALCQLEGNISYPTVGLDCTASGLQLISLVLGERKIALETNLIPSETDTCRDVYLNVHSAVTHKPEGITRKQCKSSLMQSTYGGTKTARETYGKYYNHFLDGVDEVLPNALGFVDLMHSFWNPENLIVEWVMPDGFHVILPSEAIETTPYTFMGKEYFFEKKVNAPQAFSLKLPANFIHSLDSFVLREVVTRCSGRITPIPNKAKLRELERLEYLTGFKSARQRFFTGNTYEAKYAFDVSTVHDCFRVGVNHANDLRKCYAEVMFELASSNVVNYLLSQIAEEEITLERDTTWFGEILFNDYAIS